MSSSQRKRPSSGSAGDEASKEVAFFRPGLRLPSPEEPGELLREALSPLALGALEDLVEELGHAADEPEPEKEVRAALERALAGLGQLAIREQLVVEAAMRVLGDHALQGWALASDGEVIRLHSPQQDRENPSGQRELIRRQERLKRDEQLAEPATRRFVEGLERLRLHGRGLTSIFNLFRDGRELAKKLRTARASSEEGSLEALKGVTDPYLVFCDNQECCPFTGLRLFDIWRYFRHTWMNQYTSVPGRTMYFLVRDRAAEFHPVVGIGAIGSPIVQIGKRDKWIGWHAETFIERVVAEPSAEIGTWLKEVTKTALEELYVQDFLDGSARVGWEASVDEGPNEPHHAGDPLLSFEELECPTPLTVARLRTAGQVFRKLHHKGAREEMPNTRADTQAADWEARARSPLFSSKRALLLAGLLEAKRVLKEYLGDEPTCDRVRELAEASEGRRVIQQLLRKAKGDRVGIAMADITVCGGVAPYGPILGGKLVSMLAASPETVEAYRSRYGGTESEIASSMAGRPIRRPSDLVFMGTTSLYGRSSQYNRVRVPAERLGGEPGDELRFLNLGESAAYGTSHYSSETVAALSRVLEQAGRQRVNYVFGEGVSPKLRKLRDALLLLGFSAEVLKHHRKRVVYGVPLVSNLLEYLLGVDAEPKYLYQASGEQATEAIADWWRERWVAMRVRSDDVLSAIEQHTLERPIRHGARVELPPEDSPQLMLFDDL